MDRRTLQIGAVLAGLLVAVFVIVPLVRTSLQPDWVGTSMQETFPPMLCMNIDLEANGKHWRGMRPADARRTLVGELHFDSEHSATFRSTDGVVVTFHENKHWGDLACAVNGAPN